MSRGRSLLIVDDEKELVGMMKDVLVSRGYEVETAFDGEEGLDKLNKRQFDLVVLDINMPKMGGIEFYRRMLLEHIPPVPTLVLTARANLEQTFLDLEVDGFMSKPFEIDDLVKSVDRIIAKRYVAEDKVKDYRVWKILLVEDNEPVSNNISLALLNSGFNLTCAKTGAEAIRVMKVFVPDIILIKLILPDQNGSVVVSRMKQLPESGKVDFVLYSSHSLSQDLSVTKRLCDSIGVKSLIETNDAGAILNEMNIILDEKKK